MSDHEERRRRLLADLEQGPGDEGRKPSLPGAAGCHELLDRTALVADLLERYIVEHAACVANAGWFALAAEAADRLHTLYQHVGEAHLGAEEAGAAGGAESEGRPTTEKTPAPKPPSDKLANLTRELVQQFVGG